MSGRRRWSGSRWSARSRGAARTNDLQARRVGGRMTQRVRKALRGEDPGPAPQRNPFRSEQTRPTPPPPLPFKRKRREWYRGEPVSDFTKRLLDEYIVPRSDPDYRP